MTNIDDATEDAEYDRRCGEVDYWLAEVARTPRERPAPTDGQILDWIDLNPAMAFLAVSTMYWRWADKAGVPVAIRDEIGRMMEETK